jgi:Tol biopolymer transport system component
MVPLDGGEPAEIVKAFAGIVSLDVSPDSKRLAFGSSAAKNQFTVVVCDLPRCANRVSLNLQSAFYGPMRFTPDGSGLAYIEVNALNIWVQPFNGGQPRQLTHFTDREISNFAYSRDGKRIAVARATTTNDIVLLKGVK